MAVLLATAGMGWPNFATLSQAQAGNGQSTNVVDRGTVQHAALLTVTTAIGALPTCTYAIEGSADGSDWWPICYADAAAPETPLVAAFVVTTAGTWRKILRAGHPWRYLRLTYSLNLNVTNTASLAVF